MPGDVFVSYSRKDEEFVLRLVNDLEDRHALAWIDRGNIHGGEQWRASIQSGIRDAKAFVLVISPNSIASPNVGEEVGLALQLGIPIIPLVYRRACIPAAVMPSYADTSSSTSGAAGTATTSSTCSMRSRIWA